MLLVANVKFFLKFGNQNCTDARPCVLIPDVMPFVF